jgi:hypothetical protein
MELRDKKRSGAVRRTSTLACSLEVGCQVMARSPSAKRRASTAHAANPAKVQRAPGVAAVGGGELEGDVPALPDLLEGDPELRVDGGAVEQARSGDGVALAHREAGQDEQAAVRAQPQPAEHPQLHRRPVQLGGRGRRRRRRGGGPA